MESNIHKLGEYLATVDNRNTDLAITNLQGVSISKEFIPSIANIVGTDLSSYKIVRTGQFAYGPVTSRNGDKISIARLTSDDCIISSSYTPFEVTRPDILDPDYLMLWFMRPEFDRYARYMSNGSAREVFDWDCMCNVDIPVPPIEEQRKIVRQYKILNNRFILLNQIIKNLEEQALVRFKVDFELFLENGGTMPSGWRESTIGDVVSVTRGASPRPIESYMASSGMPWVKISDATKSFSKYLSATEGFIIEKGVKHSRQINPGTMIVSNSASPGLPMIMDITACVHDGWLIIDNYSDVSQEYLYYHFINERTRLVASSNGSVFNNLKTDIVKKHRIVIPDSITMARFTDYVKAINTVIKNYAKEMMILDSLKTSLLQK